MNPGNSGGALVDLDGRVVGIPTLAATDAIGAARRPASASRSPSNIVTDIAGQMVKNVRVVNSHRAYLGVSLAGGVTGGQGAVVSAVEKGGPADKARITVAATRFSRSTASGHPTRGRWRSCWQPRTPATS